MLGLGVAFGGACSGDDEAAGAGAAGGGAGGATQSTSSTAGTAGTAGSGGTGGSGAAGGGPPGFGEAAVWAALPASIAGCTIEQLQNPTAVRAFYWESCGVGCTSAVFRPEWPVTDIIHGEVTETANGIFVALEYESYPPQNRWLAVFAREDGMVLQAFRTLAGTSSSCELRLPSTDGAHYAFIVDWLHAGNDTKYGAGFGPLDGSVPTFGQDLVPAPTGIGPQIHSEYGPTRWLWYFYPDKLLGLSSLDGSGVSVVAQSQASGPILAVNGPKWTGDQFLFEQANLVGNTVQGVLARSDGTAPSQTYLAAPDGSYYGQPEYAHTRLGWFHGTGQLNVNQFTTVEIMASPYSYDPAGLAPYKVADWPRQFMPVDHVGGHGWLVTSGLEVGKIWAINLETSEWRSLYLPGAPSTPNGAGMNLYRLLGITSGAVWALGRPYPVVGNINLMARLALE